MSRLKDLLETEIKYQNGRILTSSADFFKDNSIAAATCQNVVAKARASSEYKSIMGEGYIEKSGPIQTKRATFVFKPNTQNPNWKGVYYEFTCFPTGLVRAQSGSLGGKPYELKVEAPTQLTDPASQESAMLSNLMATFRACLEKLGKTAMQKVSRSENRKKDAEKLESYNWPPGFTMSILGDKIGWCKQFKDGTYQINIKEFNVLNIVMADNFDHLPIEISEVRRQVGAVSAKKTDDYLYLDLECKNGLKDFTGFPRNIKCLTVHGYIDWKEATKYFSHVHELKFGNANWKTEDYDFPMMRIMNLPGIKVLSLQNYGGKDSDLAKGIQDILQAGINRQLDEFEVQERLMDLGLKKAPR